MLKPPLLCMNKLAELQIKISDQEPHSIPALPFPALFFLQIVLLFSFLNSLFSSNVQKE